MASGTTVTGAPVTIFCSIQGEGCLRLSNTYKGGIDNRVHKLRL